ncbi:MAG TPA: hypothetical protein DCL86_03280, partial [Bacteroidales bacterium]|nr:hypothetical protein [Bacteroidales bacterium]
VTDIDGNVYKTIKIGDQVWMAENLRVTRYRNGDSIFNVLDNEIWSTAAEGAYCNYNNTLNMDTIATYGRLYNWYAAADQRNIAPKGWRVPDIDDWSLLIEYLGGDSIVGVKLKESGDLHWESPNFADNSSGFTAIPSGFRYRNNKNFQGAGLFNSYWAMPIYDLGTAPFLSLFSWNSIFHRGINYNVNGYSIRCIRD